MKLLKKMKRIFLLSIIKKETICISSNKIKKKIYFELFKTVHFCWVGSLFWKPGWNLAKMMIFFLSKSTKLVLLILSTKKRATNGSLTSSVLQSFMHSDAFLSITREFF